MAIEVIEVELNNDRSSRVRATATVKLDHAIVVHGVKLVAGRQGVFAAGPSRRFAGEFQPLVEIEPTLEARLCDAIAASLPDGWLHWSREVGASYRRFEDHS